MQNLRLGVAERLGVGYDQVRAHQPDIVYLSVSAFGYGGAVGLSYTLVRRLREGTWAAAGLLALAALSARPTPLPTSVVELDENGEGRPPRSVSIC